MVFMKHYFSKNFNGKVIIMIKNSTWIKDSVKQSFDSNKCVYEQKPQFYIKMNNQLRKDCDWCPFDEGEPCEVCGGLDEVLMHECYDCNKCGNWGDK